MIGKVCLFIAFFLAVAYSNGWDAYIDNMIAQSKDSSGVAHIDKGCIIGLDGGAFWTSQRSDGKYLGVSTSQASSIAQIVRSGNFASFMSNGVTIAGVKYQFLRENDGKDFYFKKKGHGAITIGKSHSAIVIAHCAEGKQQGNCNKGVEVIRDYLESLGM